MNRYVQIEIYSYKDHKYIPIAKIQLLFKNIICN